MQLRRFGRSDVMISPIILGTWQAGRRYWVGIDDRDSVHTIEAALDAGITTIDTAEEYGDGHSERIVGEALAGKRERAVILTKVFSNHLRREPLIAACEASLRRLRTEVIDVYQVHWPAGSWGSDAVPIGETMEALLQLKDSGKIRAIGVSNFSRAQLQEASRHGRIDGLQPPYSLFWRHVERDARPYCIDHDISILAYSSLAQGLLAGRFGPDHTFAEGDHRSDGKLLQPEHHTRLRQALAALQELAAGRGVTMAQLALAWTLAQPQTSAIAGARHPDQARDNAAAAALALSAEELDAIDRIGRPVAAPFLDDPLMWTWDP